jgi:hypothetical protein
MPNDKIKVSAPRENPHICYVSREYSDKIKEIKQTTGMSFYTLLCTCSGYLLNSRENIKNFRNQVRENGFKNIGEWAECLIEFIHDHLDDINLIDLTSVQLKKKASGVEEILYVQYGD